ncbi:MAG: GNAT family N-acetyltransferase [Bacteroidetes bacterium]|nr:MAG: GNAT family N-acetyltransferase [Bacteroidota bacterium]
MDICLKTGYSGKDASDLFTNKELLAFYFALPYLQFEPELCFIAEVENKIAGYIIGTSNTKEFAAWMNDVWLPPLRERYKVNGNYKTDFERWVVKLINEGYKLSKFADEYPAHLHIDILPFGQGKGIGKKLINIFMDKLNPLNVSGVHLEVGKKNTNAIGFYEKMGFTRLADYENSIVFGKKLSNV